MPGMKVVSPSNAYDAKGLMISAIRDPNPVIFRCHKGLQGIGWLGTVKRIIAMCLKSDADSTALLRRTLAAPARQPHFC